MPKATTPISGSRQGRRHNPLETDLTATPLKIKGEKRKSRHQDEGDQFVDSKASRKILRMGQELADDDVEENSVQPANKAFDFESRLDDDEEEVPGQEEYEEWGDEEAVRKNAPYELFNLYVKFNAELEKDPSLNEQVRSWTRKLEKGDPEARSLWSWFREETIKDFNRMYERMDISFTETIGESFFHDRVHGVVDELERKELAVESEGALVVKFALFTLNGRQRRLAVKALA